MRENWFFRWEVPTWMLTVAIYAIWGALVWFHAYLPWWLLLAAGAYIIALHFSLQHEAIHGWRSCPGWLRKALVWPPIGLWFPFAIYHRSHSRHHRNADLTYPGKDTESLYHAAATWEGYSPLRRKLLMFNQTMLGRLTIGPLFRLNKLVVGDLGKFLRGDYSDTGIWILHLIGCVCILWFVVGWADMPFWQYILFFFYPGMMLSWLRPFLEHRWGEKPYERVAAIESNWFFGLLFLWNNLHIVHHRHPTMPWYRIPAYFKRHREELLAKNGGYYYPGYWSLARKYLLRPVFTPIHPETISSGKGERLTVPGS